MVKMEFGDKALLNGDPPKVDCSPDSPAEINYTETINVSYDDPLILDEIVHKPVVCKYVCSSVGLVQDKDNTVI